MFTTYLNIPESDNNGIRIYPNPVRDELTIDNVQLIMSNNVEVYDVSGKKIDNCGLSIVNSIDVSTLPAGIYFVKIETDKGIVTKKFIKE